MTLNGRQSTSGSEIGTHINSDLEDGEYRSPDRDIPEQKLMHYETYDQTDSEENRPLSRKSYSSCIKRTNSDSERSSNVNTRQLSPVSSASFSSHDFEHKDLYEDTLFIPNMNVSNDNEGFQTECMSARNDKFRIDCLPRSRINRSDENEAIVTLQPEILAKKRRMIVEIKDVLQTLEDAVHLDIAAETMKILMEEGTGLSARNVYDKLQERVDSLDNWFEIEDVIEEKFTMEYTASSNDDNLGRKVICQPKNCSIKICKFSDTRSNANCKCDALHICKFFMLSECQDMFCAFGHDLRTEHNVRILKKHFLHRLTIKQLKAFIRQKQTRNETTIPLICNFYNSVRGCKHENMTEDTECSYIHVCRYYTRNNCKFGSGCKRSHDLLSGQSLKILKLYGLEQNPSEEILTLLNKKVDPSDHINKEQREECKDSMLQDKNKEMSREIDKLAQEDSIEESVDYIPVETEPQQVRVRYFTQQYVSTDAYAGQHEVGNGTENKLTWGQGDASVQSKNNQTRKRNGMFSESKSSNKTNI